MKLASLALLWHPLAILVGTAVACYVWATTADPGTALAWLKNPGPHGFSEMLYEFTSAAANNGSGFEGPGRQHAVLEHLDGPGDAALALHPDHRAAGAGRCAGGQACGAGDGRVAERRQRHVRHHVVGRHRHPRPVDVHAGRRARADCRASGVCSRGDASWSKRSSKRVLFTLVTMVLLGGGYNVALWGIGQAVFPSQAEGSLIRRADGTVVGLAADRPEVHAGPSTSSRGRPASTTTPRRPAAPTTGRRTRIT